MFDQFENCNVITFLVENKCHPIVFLQNQHNSSQDMYLNTALQKISM